MRLYKNTSGGNHHICNKLMLIPPQSTHIPLPVEGTEQPNARRTLFIYIFFSYWRLLSGAIDLGAAPFVLWSNKAAYWFIGGRQLPFASPSCSPFRFTVGSPERKSLVYTGKLKPLHFAAIHSVSIVTLRFEACAKIQCKSYWSAQAHCFPAVGFGQDWQALSSFTNMFVDFLISIANLHSGINGPLQLS